ncbi:DUF4969 domain-containing protein [Listeria rocourtiae]|uniref:DUF4969 domain-containing protein n=1 Tax=Listeria rocourtiae TaxID=647910 RepID=UPI003D2F74FD
MKKILILTGVLLIFSLSLVACGKEESRGDTNAEKTPKVEEKKEIELSIDQSYIQSDDNGKIVITGKIDPKAKLSSKGTNIPVDSNGVFSYTLSFEGSLESSIVASLRATRDGYNDKDYDITVYNNSKSYKEKVAKEEANQKIADEKIAKENELLTETEEKTDDASIQKNNAIGSQIDTTNLTDNSDGTYTSNDGNLFYMVNESNEIFRIEETLTDSPSFPLDEHETLSRSQKYLPANATVDKNIVEDENTQGFVISTKDNSFNVMYSDIDEDGTVDKIYISNSSS